jgi:MFS family permease
MQAVELRPVEGGARFCAVIWLGGWERCFVDTGLSPRAAGRLPESIQYCIHFIDNEPLEADNAARRGEVAEISISRRDASWPSGVVSTASPVEKQTMMDSISVRRAMNLLVSFLNLTIGFSFGVSSLPVFYPVLARSYRWNHASVAAGGSIVLLLIGIASPLIGWLVDKYSAKSVLLTGMGTVALGLALLSLTHDLGQYYLFCVVLGLGACAVSILPNSILIASRFSRRRGVAVGVINAGIGLGGFIAPILASSQISARGVSPTFLLLSLCIAIPFVLTLVIVRNPDSQIRMEDSPSQLAGNVPGAGPLLRMPMFWIFGISLFLAAHAMIAVQQHLVLYLVGQGFNARSSALALSTVLGASAIGKILSGAVVDRFSARFMMLLSILCVGLGIAALETFVDRANLVFLCAMVFGLGYGGIFNAPALIVFEHFGTYRVGRVLGILIVFFGLGSATGGLLAGFIYDRSHGYSVPFGVDLGFACMALLLLLAGGRQTRLAPVTTPV